MFKVGDYMVHENSGICIVEEITKLTMPGAQNSRMYYVLLPIYTRGSKVYSPVDNTKVIMRGVISIEDAKKLLSELPQMEMLQTEELERGEDPYKEALHSCDCRIWARMVKSLYKKRNRRIQQGKKLASSDEKYLKQAKEYLCQELAIVLESTETEVEKYILEQVSRI